MLGHPVKVNVSDVLRNAKIVISVRTEGRNYTNFKSSLAMIRAKKRKNCNLGKDGRTELYQFQKQLSYDGDVSPCQV